MTKIPPNLHALILEKSGEGLNSEQIAAWLWNDHKVEVGASSVRRLLEKDRSERADVAKSVVRTELRKRLLATLSHIDRIVKRAAGVERRALDRAARLRAPSNPQGHEFHPLADEQDKLALKAMRLQAVTLDRFLFWSGLGAPDAPGETTRQPVDKNALVKRLVALIGKPANDAKVAN